ncbi:MAG TPA: 50S ribosomal protein L11 methyltransferase [Dongiaceae bacterium]
MKTLWTVRLRTTAGDAAAAESALEPFAIALSRYEIEGGRRWEVEALIDGQPKRAAIRKALAEWAKPDFARLPSRDWVAQSRRALPAITAGRFYLRGAHVKGATPRGKIALQVDAGAAFGTGRHETTRGCLLALDRLARRRRFKHPLDLGCGSGVLALAAASLWPVKVLAADNDPDAVRVARENAVINGLDRRLSVVKSSGYGAGAIRRAAPFDLIMANILARPLYRMAGSLARHLAPGGSAVLSGILASQEQLVLHAQLQHGLELDFRLRLGDWSVLVLRQPRARKPRGRRG